MGIHRHYEGRAEMFSGEHTVVIAGYVRLERLRPEQAGQSRMLACGAHMIADMSGVELVFDAVLCYNDCAAGQSEF